MTEKLKVLDLFSGIGGFSLGLERTGGFETIAFCEIEKFPQRVLRKHWPEVPIHDDIRQLTAQTGPASVDLICGGYPCQPFSSAGQRKGKKDDRHLWPEVSRLLDEYRPRWGLFENVAGHISMGLDDVLSDLENKGYTCRTFVIPACALNAPHRRDRVWILAHAEGERHRQRREAGDISKENGRQERFVRWEPFRASEQPSDLAYAPLMQRNGREHNSEACARQASKPRSGRCSPYVSDPECIGQSRQRGAKGRMRSAPKGKGQADWIVSNSGWKFEPGMGRVANGVPSGVDRLKSLGNAVVPQIPEMIGYAILEAEASQ